MWKLSYQQQPKSIDVFMDADFAATMLRSTSGVAEYYERAPIEFAFQYGERASAEHRRSEVLRNHEGLSAQLAQPGHFERIRG